MESNNKKPGRINLSSEEIDDLCQCIEKCNLPDYAKDIILSLISLNVWLSKQLSNTKMTLKRLKKLLGFKSESSKKANNNSSNDNEDNQEPSDDNTSSEENHENDKPNKQTTTNDLNWNTNLNHGRYSVEDYTGCPIIHIEFSDENLKKGLCSHCAKCNTIAKIEKITPKMLVFLEGQPMITGQRYYLERGRCCVCKTYFTAPLPDELAGRSKYSPSCVTSIVIHHYYGGSPFKRIETLQKLQGVPFADATQFDYVNHFYTESVAPVINVLRQCAADGDSLFFDDSPGRILEQMKINKTMPKNESSGIHITALLSNYNNHKIYLFNTNKKTAGKEFASLIAHRASEASFLTMTDASANNFFTLNDDLMAKWVITLCLAHGRRYFVDLIGEDDQDVNLVLDIIAQVYKNEKHCKEMNLSDEERLLYHHLVSEPVMRMLRTWLNNLMLYNRVEPNSQFGKAVIYLLKRWEWLTQFLRVPGAALDNNICEIAIKIAIRYRKNSLFYKTFYGATIGDAMMSLIHTAACAEVNIFDYLNALQIYETHVQATPKNWLPWNYQQTITKLNNNEVAYVDTG